MKITTLNEASGSPYMTKEHLAELLSCTKVTINTRMKEIEEEVKNGRYGQHAIIRDGGIVLINYLVWIDYLRWRKQLKEKNLRKLVPKFDAYEVAKEIGWYIVQEVV